MTHGLLQDTLPTWTAEAVRDTVLAITQDAAYDRNITVSLWQRLLQWFAEMLSDLIRLLPPLGSADAVILFLAAALVALVLARFVLQARAQREFWAGDRREGGTGRRLDPWTEAERLAAGGSYLAAAHHLCAALLMAGARRGELALHPSKTTGDYARELRRNGAPSERAFSRFRARYDRLVYDAQACSADDYAALLADARPLLTLDRAA